MKRKILFMLLLAGLLTTCREPHIDDPDENTGDPNQKTVIEFDNTQGICAVTVYSNYLQGDESIIARIPAGRLSQEFEWLPNSSTAFFFTYQINFKGISGFTIDYKPENGKNQKQVRIDPNVKTNIVVPPLEETLSSPDTLLSKSSYLFIQNNSSYSLQLLRGNVILPPDNTSETVVNSGERALYTIKLDAINSDSTSNYKLAVGAATVSFPASLTNFEAGHVYRFVYSNGVLSLVSEIELILENVAEFSPDKPVPETPGTPIISAGSGILTVHWTAVAGAEIYEVYISTTQNPPALPVKTVYSTTTIFTGLTNKTTYYLWIKALNENGASDISPRAKGIPWPDNEVPAVPGIPVIIPGINQLTVTWEQPGGASSYEVYINTTPSAPSTPSVTSDTTSAVITNLENNVIYYIWIRAVNNAGKSGYSSVEAGTPHIPTVAPAAPAKPTLTAGSREIVVSWLAVELAESYEVWLGTLDNSVYAQKYGSDITGGVTETLITGLTNETTYYVWIKAKNVVGASGFSLSASGTPSAFILLPETPGMPLVFWGNGELTVSWQAVEGALFYEVWMGTASNSTYTIKYGADVSGTSVTLTSLNNGTTYYIWIKAKNNVGTSSFSPMTSGKPQVLGTPDAPNVMPGLYRGAERIGNQNISESLTYISANAVTGDEFYIVIGANESVSPVNLSYPGKTVGITLLGYGSERTITLSSDGSMFTISSGATLTIEENVTLVGRSANTASLIKVSLNRTFIMNGGTIRGNTTSNSGGGGVSISPDGTTFIMNGGTISGNTVSGTGTGGGVYNIGGIFIMNGGIINGNTSSNGGGIGGSGTFTLNGGTIIGNTSSRGGGVLFFSDTTFTMNGGIISDNTAWSGGGVYMSGGTFNMHGGTISGNTADYGGGVHYGNGTFKKLSIGVGQNSGIIYGSEAVGNDVNGVPLRNRAGNDISGHAVFSNYNNSFRNTTAGQTDQIDSSTGRGLSANGFAPFGN